MQHHLTAESKNCSCTMLRYNARELPRLVATFYWVSKLDELNKKIFLPLNLSKENCLRICNLAYAAYTFALLESWKTYWKYNVNMGKRVGKDRVFLRLAGLILRISFGLCPQEIPWSSPTSPQKTRSVPPLLLCLTQSSKINWLNI